MQLDVGLDFGASALGMQQYLGDFLLFKDDNNSDPLVLRPRSVYLDR